MSLLKKIKSFCWRSQADQFWLVFIEDNLLSFQAFPIGYLASCSESEEFCFRDTNDLAPSSSSSDWPASMDKFESDDILKDMKIKLPASLLQVGHTSCMGFSCLSVCFSGPRWRHLMPKQRLSSLRPISVRHSMHKLVHSFDLRY